MNNGVSAKAGTLFSSRYAKWMLPGGGRKSVRLAEKESQSTKGSDLWIYVDD